MKGQERYTKYLFKIGSSPTMPFKNGEPAWYISKPAHDGNIKIGNNQYNVTEICKTKVFEKPIDITPFLIAAYKSFIFEIAQVARVYPRYIGKEVLNSYVNLFKKQQLTSVSDIEFMAQLSNEFYNSRIKKISDIQYMTLSLANRLYELSRDSHKISKVNLEDFDEYSLDMLPGHMEYIIPEIINVLALIFGKGQSWADQEEFEKDVVRDITEVLQIDNTFAVSLLVSYKFLVSINDNCLANNKKLQLIKLDADALLEKVLKTGGKLKLHLSGFASSELVYLDRNTSKDGLTDLEKEVLAIYLGTQFVVDNSEILATTGIAHVISSYSNGSSRLIQLRNELKFDIIDPNKQLIEAVREYDKIKEALEKYKMDAQRDRLAKVECERELKKARKDLRKQEDAIKQLNSSLDRIKKAKSEDKLKEKHAKLEDESKEQAERITELEGMIEDLVEENRDKSRKSSALSRQNKKVCRLLQQYGLLDEEDDVIKEQTFETDYSEVSFEEKIECLNQFKIAIGGGWDDLANRVEALGVTNLVKIKTVSEADKSAKYDMLVIVADFISHTLAYKLLKQAESFGADKMYFSGTNANKLVDDLYSQLVD